MIVTFKSRAAGDVMMFGEVAEALLQYLGKDPKAPKGIFTTEQLPEAIRLLKALMVQDKAAGAHAHEHDEDEDRPQGMAAPVALWQRAVPLVEQMQYSLAEDQPVIWGD
ncbi:DUF1840 domain-containing protein [Niveibacterium sp. SC-1]|uniref:DUF1840 domain-containing protein n=1 Tax=Niveibacterium sp. SC-1 TaxID=3135646 RepID=UPI00311EA525